MHCTKNCSFSKPNKNQDVLKHIIIVLKYTIVLIKDERQRKGNTKQKKELISLDFWEKTHTWSDKLMYVSSDGGLIN